MSATNKAPTHAHNCNQTGTVANQNWATCSNAMLVFLCELGIQQIVMYTKSNEIPTQNQLVMSGVTHKLIYKLIPFNFVNVGQHPLLYYLILSMW